MSITKVKGAKDGRQKYRVRVSYKDGEGKFHQKERTAYGRDEAKILEMQLISELKDKKPDKRITLNVLFAEYYAAHKSEVRETTMLELESRYRLHIAPKLGNYTLSDLSVSVLQQWKNWINERPLANRTKKNIYSCLRSILNYAVKMEHIIRNPLIKVGTFTETVQIKKEMQFYTPKEFELFIAAALEYAQNSAESIAWDYYVFFMIAFYTGMRKGEIYSLKWSDIWDNTIHLRRNVTQKLKGADKETAPKNSSSIRDIQIPNPLFAVLKEHKERWSNVDGFSDDYRICGGTRSLRDSTVASRNIKFADAAGVKRIRIHDFRHSHASVLANNNVNIQEIARRLGHSDVKITLNTYSHLYPQEKEYALSVLDTLFNP